MQETAGKYWGFFLLFLGNVEGIFTNINLRERKFLHKVTFQFKIQKKKFPTQTNSYFYWIWNNNSITWKNHHRSNQSDLEDWQCFNESGCDWSLTYPKYTLILLYVWNKNFLWDLKLFASEFLIRKIKSLYNLQTRNFKLISSFLTLLAHSPQHTFQSTRKKNQ